MSFLASDYECRPRALPADLSLPRNSRSPRWVPKPHHGSLNTILKKEGEKKEMRKTCVREGEEICMSQHCGSFRTKKVQ